ncbi:MAG: hypothetical protein ILP17_06645 [Lachnospiraceae bacterium]|nr:hypothetical protein [Lachnospiraceae bacterium]
MKKETVSRESRKRGGKALKLILSIIGGILALAAIMFGVYKLAIDPHRGVNRESAETLPLDERLTTDQAIEDIDYVMEMFRERHPAWLEDGNNRVAAVEEQYQEEVLNLRNSGASEISVLEEWQMISRIMHCLYDGHSCVYSSGSNVRYLEDFSMLRTYGPPVMIDGRAYEDVLNDFCNVFQYETESYAQAVFDSNIICNEDYLRWTGIDTSDGVDMVFDTGDGVTESCHYDFVPIDDVAGREEGEDSVEWVYYEIDEDNGIGIFTLTSCDYNSEYRKKVHEFFKAVDEAGIEHIIVDLRWNGGGSSMVGDEFIHYLDVDGYYSWPVHVRYGSHLLKWDKSYIRNNRKDPLYHGDVYVLTNQRTFSAAMDFAMDIMDNDLGILVGEPSGNLPESYGDILLFDTPNSHLNFQISYKRWFRIDETKSGQPLDPDYPCSSEEAMDRAYELILGN